jgi:hypothetical protein
MIRFAVGSNLRASLRGDGRRWRTSHFPGNFYLLNLGLNLGLRNETTRATIPLVRAKKTDSKIRGTPAPNKVRGIRLLPSTSDYETFVETTATAMGKTVNHTSSRKPNRRLLSLLNLGV